MAIDDSFKKPGSVPFKWEIRPGLPKVVQHQQQQQEPSLVQQQEPSLVQQHNISFPSSPQMLTPPPTGLHFNPPMELRTQHVMLGPRTRSERLRFDRPALAGPKVALSGCFPVHRGEKKRTPTSKPKTKAESDSESDYASDLETLSRWSISTQKSLQSPFRDSLSSSSFSSYQSSPRPTSDIEWGAFGLF